MAKYLTQQGLKKLKKEFDYLEKNKRKKVSEKIRYAASQGDLKENAAYHAAKEEQSFVEGRINELREILAQAKVIEKKQGNQVQIGSSVCLESDEGEEKFQLVSPEEVDILQGKISFKSPLGRAILNKKKGDVFEIDTPDGKKKYEIVEIE